MSTYYGFKCEKCKLKGGFQSRQAWGTGNADLIDNFKFTMYHALNCGTEYIGMYSEYDDCDYPDTNIDGEARKTFLEETRNIMPGSSDWKFVSTHSKGDNWPQVKELWVKNELDSIEKEQA
jgi:hypothetical protein